MGKTGPFTASFTAALCLAWPDGQEEIYEGRVDGTLVWPPRGGNGFGYDPMFLPSAQVVTLGEMTPEAKAKISHRTRAFEALLAGAFSGISPPPVAGNTASRDIQVDRRGEAAPLYHGTRADLKPGDLITPGYMTNFGSGKTATHVYLSATLDAATWGAELAQGEGPARIYIVDPTGPIYDDPNLTDKKFPGNPTKSYRTQQPLRVVGELKEWQGHSPEQLDAMKAGLEKLQSLGVHAVDD
jgi:rifampin ADP-ribosylating transferase